MTLYKLLCWSALFFVQLVHAQLSTDASNATNGIHLVCVPFGTCEPCPEDALHEPFCQPYGNRRLVHCLPALTTDPDSIPMSLPHVHSAEDAPTGETPAWESCGRIVEKERGDFFEFFVCNLFLGVIATAVLLARSKRLQAIQTRQLAARIGLVRAVPGGWAGG